MSVTVLNTDAGLSGKTLVNLEDGQTITGAKTFDRDPNPPFVVTSGSAVVPNLDADKLDGLDSLAFVKADGTVAMTGALTMTSGQIAFPATQVPSAGANTLDDYEEGTFTPTWSSSPTAPALGNGVLAGSYVKIGQFVYVAITLVMGNTTTFGGANPWSFTLPFTAANVSTNFMGCGQAFDSSAGAYYAFMSPLAAAGNAISMYLTTAGTTGGFNSTGPFAWATSDTINLSIAYRANA
jgi:hypothetical protein